jgi:hypothetical protein
MIYKLFIPLKNYHSVSKMSLRLSSTDVLNFTGSQEVLDAVHNLRFVIAGRPEFPTPKYFAGPQEMYARHVFFHWVVERFQGSLFYSLAKEMGEHGEIGRFRSRRLFNAFIDGRLDLMTATLEAHKAVKELRGDPKANYLAETRMTMLLLEEVYVILNCPSMVESSME